MQGISPPKDASPAELKAWHEMMESMVTFIKAATNLMTAVTSRVDISVKPSRTIPPPARTVSGALPQSRSQHPQGACEPKCTICAPKPALPPCGVCGKTRIPVRPASAARVASKQASVVVQKKGSKQAEEISDDFEVVEKPTEEEEEEIDMVVVAQDVRPEEPKPDKPAEETKAEEPAEEPKAEEPAEEPAQEVVNEEQKGEAENVEVAAKSKESVKEAASVTKKPSAAAQKKADEDCVCAALKAKKKKTCLCKDEEPPPPPPPEESDEDDCDCKPDDSPPECSCPPSDLEREQMVQELKDKLLTAQCDIEDMQKDLDKLQRMDASKKVGPHGGPNPAALYKEIMRDSSGPIQAVTYEESMPRTSSCPCPGDAPPSCPCPSDAFQTPQQQMQQPMQQQQMQQQRMQQQQVPQTPGYQTEYTQCPCSASTFNGPPMWASTPYTEMSGRPPTPKKICGPPNLINSIRMQMSQMSPPPPISSPGYFDGSSTRYMQPYFNNRGGTNYPEASSQQGNATPGRFSGCNPCPMARPAPQMPNMRQRQQWHSLERSPMSSYGCSPNTCVTSGGGPGQAQSGMNLTPSFLQNANVVTCPTRYRGGNSTK